jgi:transcriptional regulator of aromatic amino acid metabolism
MPGKGYLLFQKFISKNAYRYTACISDEQREDVEQKLNAAMEENGTSVNEKLFDDILDTIEKELLERLYKPFLKSDYYLKWKEAMVLNEGMA